MMPINFDPDEWAREIMAAAVLTHKQKSVMTEFNGDESELSHWPACLYYCQLDPKCRPERFRIGVSVLLAKRLSQMRTNCPEAKILWAYGYGYGCEDRVRHELKTNCSLNVRHVGRDVFETFSHDALKKHIEVFIADLIKNDPSLLESGKKAEELWEKRAIQKYRDRMLTLQPS
jgi:hypothetical protein